jgi:hypothetical protein
MRTYDIENLQRKTIMKPFYGTWEHVKWVGMTGGIFVTSTWTCHSCGSQRTGARIMNCESCGEYPQWKYIDSSIVVAKTWAKQLLLRLIGTMIGHLKIIKNKLDDQGFE